MCVCVTINKEENALNSRESRVAGEELKSGSKGGNNINTILIYKSLKVF